MQEVVSSNLTAPTTFSELRVAGPRARGSDRPESDAAVGGAGHPGRIDHVVGATPRGGISRSLERGVCLSFEREERLLA